jgi:hypothetical protein
MSRNYSLPLTAEVDADSPINAALMGTRIRGTLLGLGLPNSPFAAGFLGDGSDGALTISTNTNLDCGTAGKQHTSLTLDATYTLTCTATSGVNKIGVTGTLAMGANTTITVTGKGLAGGAGGTKAEVAPEAGTSATRWGLFGATAGSGGSAQGETDGGADGGTVLAYPAAANSGLNGDAGIAAALTYSAAWWKDAGMLGPAPGGGGGDYEHSLTPDNAGGAGGAGGGVLYIECDTLEFPATATISADGAVGVQGDDDGGNAGGNGGSGAGGWVIVIARTATTNAGSVTADGGAVQTGGNGGDGGAGGAGGTIIIVLDE